MPRSMASLTLVCSPAGSAKVIISNGGAGLGRTLMPGFFASGSVLGDSSTEAGLVFGTRLGDFSLAGTGVSWSGGSELASANPFGDGRFGFVTAGSSAPEFLWKQYPVRARPPPTKTRVPAKPAASPAPHPPRPPHAAPRAPHHAL